jgi:uncharacterized membrane protein
MDVPPEQAHTTSTSSPAGGNVDSRRRLEIYERRSDPIRVLALSDGIFAIVITLLVLEIHVPDLTRGQTLITALQEIRPSLVAFLISFAIVAIAWALHRDLFTLIRRTDRTLVWLNFLYLLPLCMLPFGASLLARYDTDPVALSIYGMLLVAIALTRMGMWWYATSCPHLFAAPIDARLQRRGVALAAIPTACYVLAIVIAERAPVASLTIYAVVPAIYFIVITVTRPIGPPDPEPGDIP